MKKIGLKMLAVSAMLMVFAACNFTVNGGSERAEIRVFLGDGGSARAANPATGLPEFDNENTKITITGEDGTEIARGTTSLSADVAVGMKIIVTATVTTDAGVWRASKAHTVQAGINDIVLQLSKAPNSVGNILIAVNDAETEVTLKLASGKQLLSGVPIENNDKVYPIIARDKIGRIYVFYKETSSTRHLKRFDVEGNEDTAFETTLSAMLPSGVTISDIDTIAIDAKNNTIFLFYGAQVVCIHETTPNTFTCSAPVNMHALDTSINSIFAAAAYNGTVFFAVPISTGSDVYKLYACKAELSGTTLTLTKVGEPQSISQLRTDGSFGNDQTDCTGLFADESGVYCLLAQKDNGKHHALGNLIRYEYSDSGLTQKAEKGLNTKNPNTDGILTIDVNYFSYPIGFIGYDEDNIYIADDGVNFEYINENWHTTDNKNRIAAFNRKTSGLTFSNTDATWYAEFAEYKKPDTKVLLWEKGNEGTATPNTYGMKYWLSDDGDSAIPDSADALWVSGEQTKSPTDVFCYDQDGNLYILWHDNSTGNYSVRRFELKEDGSYETSGVDLSLISFPVSAIAVDISDGQNSLYYVYADGPSGHIQKHSWNLGDSFSTASSVSGYDLQFNANDAPVTALAANKDGVFVAVKEQASPTDPYTLRIRKYKKDAAASPDGASVVVQNASAEESHTAPAEYKSYDETVTGLQVFEGVLYGISSKIQKAHKQDDSTYYIDAFKNSGVLYKIGTTKDAFSVGAKKLAEKAWNDSAKIGYSFYRFIALKPKKLVIASDGAWGENGIASGKLSPKPSAANNTDKVMEYDLQGTLQAENNAGGSFTKTLELGSGFDW